MKRRTIIVLVAIAAVFVVLTRRSLWVGAIRRKWGARVPFVLDYEDSFWATLSLGELVSAYFSGLPSWAANSDEPGMNQGSFS